MAEGGVGRGCASNATSGLARHHQHQGLTPVGQGVKPAAPLRPLSGHISAETDQALLIRWFRQRFLRRFAFADVAQLQPPAIGQGCAGLAHQQLRQGACTHQQRNTCGHGGPAHHYHRITANFVPRAP